MFKYLILYSLYFLKFYLLYIYIFILIYILYICFIKYIIYFIINFIYFLIYIFIYLFVLILNIYFSINIKQYIYSNYIFIWNSFLTKYFNLFWSFVNSVSNFNFKSNLELSSVKEFEKPKLNKIIKSYLNKQSISLKMNSYVMTLFLYSINYLKMNPLGRRRRRKIKRNFKKKDLIKASGYAKFFFVNNNMFFNENFDHQKMFNAILSNSININFFYEFNFFFLNIYFDKLNYKKFLQLNKNFVNFNKKFLFDYKFNKKYKINFNNAKHFYITNNLFSIIKFQLNLLPILKKKIKLKLWDFNFEVFNQKLKSPFIYNLQIYRKDKKKNIFFLSFLFSNIFYSYMLHSKFNFIKFLKQYSSTLDNFDILRKNVDIFNYNNKQYFDYMHIYKFFELPIKYNYNLKSNFWKNEFIYNDRINNKTNLIIKNSTQKLVFPWFNFFYYNFNHNIYKTLIFSLINEPFYSFTKNKIFENKLTFTFETKRYYGIGGAIELKEITYDSYEDRNFFNVMELYNYEPLYFSAWNFLNEKLNLFALNFSFFWLPFDSLVFSKAKAKVPYQKVLKKKLNVNNLVFAIRRFNRRINLRSIHNFFFFFQIYVNANAFVVNTTFLKKQVKILNKDDFLVDGRALYLVFCNSFTDELKEKYLQKLLQMPRSVSLSFFSYDFDDYYGNINFNSMSYLINCFYYLIMFKNHKFHFDTFYLFFLNNRQLYFFFDLHFTKLIYYNYKFFEFYYKLTITMFFFIKFNRFKLWENCILHTFKFYRVSQEVHYWDDLYFISAIYRGRYSVIRFIDEEFLNNFVKNIHSLRVKVLKEYSLISKYNSKTRIDLLLYLNFFYKEYKKLLYSFKLYTIDKAILSFNTRNLFYDHYIPKINMLYYNLYKLLHSNFYDDKIITINNYYLKNSIYYQNISSFFNIQYSKDNYLLDIRDRYNEWLQYVYNFNTRLRHYYFENHDIAYDSIYINFLHQGPSTYNLNNELINFSNADFSITINNMAGRHFYYFNNDFIFLSDFSSFLNYYEFQYIDTANTILLQEQNITRQKKFMQKIFLPKKNSYNNLFFKFMYTNFCHNLLQGIMNFNYESYSWYNFLYSKANNKENNLIFKLLLKKKINYFSSILSFKDYFQYTDVLFNKFLIRLKLKKLLKIKGLLVFENIKLNLCDKEFFIYSSKKYKNFNKIEYNVEFASLYFLTPSINNFFFRNENLNYKFFFNNNFLINSNNKFFFNKSFFWLNIRNKFFFLPIYFKNKNYFFFSFFFFFFNLPFTWFNDIIKFMIFFFLNFIEFLLVLLYKTIKLAMKFHTPNFLFYFIGDKLSPFLGDYFVEDFIFYSYYITRQLFFWILYNPFASKFMLINTLFSLFLENVYKIYKFLNLIYVFIIYSIYIFFFIISFILWCNFILCVFLCFSLYFDKFILNLVYVIYMFIKIIIQFYLILISLCYFFFKYIFSLFNFIIYLIFKVAIPIYDFVLYYYIFTILKFFFCIITIFYNILLTFINFYVFILVLLFIIFIFMKKIYCIDLMHKYKNNYIKINKIFFFFSKIYLLKNSDILFKEKNILYFFTFFSAKELVFKIYWKKKFDKFNYFNKKRKSKGG